MKLAMISGLALTALAGAALAGQAQPQPQMRPPAAPAAPVSSLRSLAALTPDAKMRLYTQTPTKKP